MNVPLLTLAIAQYLVGQIVYSNEEIYFSDGVIIGYLRCEASCVQASLYPTYSDARFFNGPASIGVCSGGGLEKVQPRGSKGEILLIAARASYTREDLCVDFTGEVRFLNRAE